jgi:dihydroxyacetone kinase-like predicted kinase
MAAEQAGELYKDANVIVLPSKNVGVGYAALAAADLSADPEELKAGMLESISRVTAGYISPSIRDTQIDGVNINNGDTLGIIGKEIVVSVQSRVTAAVALADALLSGENAFMLTAFVGEDAEDEEIRLVEEKIRAMHPNVEIYFANGGQEIYPYIFVAE